MIVITLPYPISANRYWTQFTIRGRQMQAPSKEAKVFKREVAERALEQGLRKPIAGRVALTLRLYPQRPQDAARRIARNPMNWDDDVRCLDLDNSQKVAIDALKGIVFEDDKWVWRILAERMEPDGEARLVVAVEPIMRVSPQAALPIDVPRETEDFFA
jgi:crossover junction endodeoxyribonuclease RusA